VVKSGYRIGERVVRAAQVIVVDPEQAAPTDSEQAGEQAGEQEPTTQEAGDVPTQE
jgi:molecular chaperone GrpE